MVTGMGHQVFPSLGHRVKTTGVGSTLTLCSFDHVARNSNPKHCLLFGYETDNPCEVSVASSF